MEKHWVEEIFEESGAILKGHFFLTSGRHSGEYLDKALVYVDPEQISELCDAIAIGQFMQVYDIEVVVGPALGGISLSQWTAYHLSGLYGEKVRALFTEKGENKKQVLSRGYQKLAVGKKVLIVDDILTTGASVKAVIEAVQGSGGVVEAVAVICNRGGVTSDDIGGYPLFSLWNKKTESWEPDKCPLCKDGIPIKDPKSR